MKTRIFTAMLVGIMAISLYACGSPAKEKSDIPTKAESATAEEKTKEIEMLGGDTEATEETIEFSDDDVVGEWFEVNRFHKMVLNKDYSLEYRKDSLPQPGYWELNEDKLELNCIEWDDDALEVNNEGDHISLSCGTFEFVRFENFPTKHVNLGENAKTANAEIVLNSVEFLEEMPDLDDHFWVADEKFPKSDNQVYMKFSFDVTNSSKNPIGIKPRNEIAEGFEVFLDYNDGFLYSTYDAEAWLYYDLNAKENTKITIGNATSHSGNGIQIDPLDKASFELFLICPRTVAEDTTATKTIVIVSEFGADPEYIDVDITGTIM